MEETIFFGQVGRPHGIQGGFFLKINNRSSKWHDYKKIYIEDQAATVVQAYRSGGHLVIKVAEITSRTAVEALYNKKIYLAASELPKNEKSLPLILPGYAVSAEVNGQVITIGTVLSMDSFGAQENLEILLSDGKSAVYYPFLQPFIKKIDHHNKQIEVVYLDVFLTL